MVKQMLLQHKHTGQRFLYTALTGCYDLGRIGANKYIKNKAEKWTSSENLLNQRSIINVKPTKFLRLL